MAPLDFTANEGVVASTDTFNLVAFCVDIFHSISLSDRNLKYDDAYDLETNSKFSGTTLPPTFAGATDLSNQQIAQVGRLVNFGTELFGSADANKINQLSAVQGAIWQVINPGYTVDARNNAVDTLVAQYMNPAFTSDQSATFDMISQTGKYGSTQAKQAFAIAAVPEPSTWAMLILGFGAVGGAVRLGRRRRASYATG